MIIRCPECTSTYEISAATQVVGKKVRCSHCSHVWRVAEVEEDPSLAPETSAETAAEAEDEASREAEPALDAEPDMGERLAAESVEAEASEPAAADAGESIEEAEPDDAAPAAPAAVEKPAMAAASEPAGGVFGRVTDSRPGARSSRRREDRYSLDPFEGLPGSAPGPQADSVHGPAARISSIRSTAERRLEREHGYANGHAGPSGEASPGPGGADPLRPRLRDGDASWGREPAEQEDEAYGAFDEPAGAAPRPMPTAGGLAQKRRGSGLMVALGWLLMLAALGGIGVYALFDKERVSRTLPGTVPIYAALGMPVNVRGLEFRDVKYTWTVDGKGRPAIDVGGEIENVSGAPQMVPTVVFAFQDEAGLELFHWATPVRRSPLPPGKRSKFQARIPAPPEAVRNLQLRFAREL